MEEINYQEYQEVYDQAAAGYDPASVDALGVVTGGVLASFGLFHFALLIFSIIISWIVFTKAGQAGWKVLIPFYNIYVFLQIVNRPGWWLLLFFIPFVNIIIAVVVALDLGKAFGKSAVWSIILLFFFQIIGLSILAFSKVKYTKPKH